MSKGEKAVESTKIVVLLVVIVATMLPLVLVVWLSRASRRSHAENPGLSDDAIEWMQEAERISSKAPSQMDEHELIIKGTSIQVEVSTGILHQVLGMREPFNILKWIGVTIAMSLVGGLALSVARFIFGFEP